MESRRRLQCWGAHARAPDPGRAARHRRAVERLPDGCARGHRRDLLRPGLAGRPTRDWVALANEVFEAGYQERSPKPSVAYATPPASPSAALPVFAYVGDYSNDYVGNAKVTESGGSLFVQLGPVGRKFPLAHFNRDVFVYSPMAEAPKARMGVNFLIGTDGKASEVTIEDLNEYGMGRLTRVITK